MVALDPNSLKEWYDYGLEDLRYKYDIQPTDVVLDIGAYEGSFAARIVREYRCRVICVEPTDAIDGFTDAEVIKAAAGCGTGSIMLSKERFASSVFGENREEYEAIDTAELIRSIGQVKLLKCNTEGYEFDLIPYLIESGAIALVENLQVQFHTISDQPYQEWYEAIAKELSKTHSLTYRFPYCWENWRLNNNHE